MLVSWKLQTRSILPTIHFVWLSNSCIGYLGYVAVLDVGVEWWSGRCSAGVFRRHKKTTTTTTVIRDGSRLMTAAAAAASGDERPDEHATSQSRNLQPPRPIRPPPTTTADARPWSLQHLLYTTTDELRSGRALSVAHSLLTHCSHSTRSIGSMKRSSVRPSVRLQCLSQPRRATGLLWAGDVDRHRRLPGDQRRSAANASSVTLTANVGSWTRGLVIVCLDASALTESFRECKLSVQYFLVTVYDSDKIKKYFFYLSLCYPGKCRTYTCKMQVTKSMIYGWN